MTVLAEGVALVPATCGELLQGVDGDGPILVSLPIDVDGTVRVTLTDEPEVSVSPALPKATRALELALERTGWRRGVRVELGGELPHGRGMGSSTADVAGVIGGVCACAGVTLTQAELLALLVQVEPSDSSPLRGLWAIDHVGGTRACHLGPLPPNLFLAMVDSNEPLPTLDVHRTYGAGPRIPDGTVDATQWHAPLALGRLATESALRNQQRLPNPAFDVARTVAERTGAAGVCVAHSGSVCAVICPAGIEQARSAQSEFARAGHVATVVRAHAPGLRVRRADSSLSDSSRTRCADRPRCRRGRRSGCR
ncbi:MAG TPA: hypothetical protein VN193_06100 [Candidatus Angelobacter sp.]|nr:hypothetical protein [Candidatus Angelobacter sp.]